MSSSRPLGGGDFNGDNKLDLVTPNPTEIRVLLNTNIVSLAERLRSPRETSTRDAANMSAIVFGAIEIYRHQVRSALQLNVWDRSGRVVRGPGPLSPVIGLPVARPYRTLITKPAHIPGSHPALSAQSNRNKSSPIRHSHPGTGRNCRKGCPGF
jgi:hypothetical protein